jgi:hypothetical protein
LFIWFHGLPLSDFIAERMWPEASIERSIFGTDDPDEIWQLIRDVCPEAVECFAFEVSVGALFGLLLEDGSKIAVKVHVQRDPRYLVAVQRVQAHLFEVGFPCPQPLGVRGSATFERWFEEGTYRDGHEPAVRGVIAGHLALLFRLTRELHPLAGIEPFLPNEEDPLWPVPHNVLFDFEATAQGAEWIDEIARAAKPLMDTRAGELVIGHGDWTVKHFRFDGLRPTVVYDWDSLGTDFESIFVGNTAASFTYTEHLPVAVWPSVLEASLFFQDYEAARGQELSPEERRAAQAAAVYSRAYSVRCTHAVGKDAAEIDLQEYADAFL